MTSSHDHVEPSERPQRPGAWRIWIDTGGTFTDCIGLDGEGRLHRAKVLSSSSIRGVLSAAPGGDSVRISRDSGLPPGFFEGYRLRILGGEQGADERPARVIVSDRGDGALRLESGGLEGGGSLFEIESPEEAPLLAARLMTRTPLAAPLPVAEMRLATTRGTNALLERAGARVALFITRGFGDLLAIGTQQRPDLFALEIVKPEPLYESVVEVDERLDAQGNVLRPLDLKGAVEAARALLARGIRSAAVAFLHSYLQPEHEQRLAAHLRRMGFEYVAVSSELAPLIQILPRAQTAVVDAYLGPIVGAYLAGVETPLRRDAADDRGGARLRVMTSAGGLIGADAYRPKDSLLSGPAGGVVGAARAGERAGRRRLITFDMGGTSTDVARYDGDFDYRFEHAVGSARLVAPALAIETVAAGGGSICRFDGERLLVGPESAGAKPGPACYGAGGPLTTTDVNLLLGRLDLSQFGVPINVAVAEYRYQQIIEEMEAAEMALPSRDALLEGFLQIANERMADAIRRVSVRQGYDPAEYTLVAFGGAGGQHACAVARLLGIGEALVPADAGLLSAQGLGQAVLERFVERQVLRPLAEARPSLKSALDELAAEARGALRSEGVADAEIEIRRQTAFLRYFGQDATVPVEIGAIEFGAVDALAAVFEVRYAEIFGHRPESRDIELESLRVVASTRPGDAEAEDLVPLAEGGGGPPAPRAHVCASFGAERLTVPVFERAMLGAGTEIAGPALISEPHSATVVEPGWIAESTSSGALLLSRKE